MQNYDIVAIGDTVIDAFIKLKDANVHCKINHEACELCVRFGDKVPYESVNVLKAVGNSANASVSAARLGVKSALVSTVGTDDNGKECIAELQKNNVSTEYVVQNTDYPTNYHYVLWYEVDRTILIKHAPFPYTLPEFTQKPKWMYLSSLGENSLPFHTIISEYLKNNPDVKLVFQPGTFQMKFGIEALKDIYARTEVFVCNVEEAQRILNEATRDVSVLMKKMHELGPKIVCITDGPDGAFTSDGTKAYFMPIYPDPKPPVERTGAGDAFASTFATALAMGESVETALTWAPINSMNVVQYVGAQKGLLTKTELLEWLAKAPADYKIKEI